MVSWAHKPGQGIVEAVLVRCTPIRYGSNGPHQGEGLTSSPVELLVRWVRCGQYPEGGPSWMAWPEGISILVEETQCRPRGAHQPKEGSPHPGKVPIVTGMLTVFTL